MGLFARRMLKFLSAHGKLKFRRVSLLAQCNNANIFNSPGRSQGTLCSARKSAVLGNSNLKNKLYAPLESHERTVRTFHSGSVLCAVRFVAMENRFAHRVFENLQSYSATLVPQRVEAEEVSPAEAQTLLSLSWKDLSPADVMAAFKRLSRCSGANQDDLSDGKYTDAMTAVAAACRTLDDAELKDILYHLSLWTQVREVNEPNYKVVWAALDKECCARQGTWTIDELLLFSDYWYNLQLSRFATFPWHALRKLGRKCHRLSPTDLVQCMFYINACRRNPVHMYDMEYRLESFIEELSMDELAIVAMGFFKSQTQIRNLELLARMMRMTIKNIKDINEITLAALLKIIRYSIRIGESGLLKELMKHLVLEVPRLSLQCLVHAALIGSGIQLYDKELLVAISQRFANEVKNARLKDIERLSYVMTMFNFENETHHPTIDIFLNELRSSHREEEIEKYLRSMYCCIYFMSIAHVYPEDLIARFMDPKVLNTKFGLSGYNINSAILSLDVGVEVEVPSYSGPRLSEKLKHTLAKRFTSWTPAPNDKGQSLTDKLMVGVIQSCNGLLKSSTMVHVDHVLPNFKRADIIVCLDERGSPVPTGAVLSQLPFGSVKYRPEISLDGCKWFALVIAGHNMYIRNTGETVGSMKVKLRQLKKIGYTPITIPFYEWSSLHTEEDRQDYIKHKLFS